MYVCVCACVRVCVCVCVCMEGVYVYLRAEINITDHTNHITCTEA